MLNQTESHQATAIEPGSFRDRHGRIFYDHGTVYRAVSEQVLMNWQMLKNTKFFNEAVGSGKIVGTTDANPDELQQPRMADGWAGVLRHERIPFVSYPYEWSFGMLKDAALLQLELLGKALNEGMTLKDASSFNIQWYGSLPVFIDVPSFEKLPPGTPWVGYRQFCKLFLYPLFLQAYKDVAFQSLLRGNIDGIDPEEMDKLMTKRDLLRSGVLMDVHLQAKMQKKYADVNRKVKDDLRTSGFNQQMIKANVQRLRKIVEKLKWNRSESEWSDYVRNNSYTDEDSKQKELFVRQVVGTRQWNLCWDLGCNTGRFSRIAAENASYVVAMDSDQLAVEYLYHQLKSENNRTILPLVMNVADASPNLGWRGLERKSLEGRGRPDLVLCLALIHHVVISANIPLREFIGWLASLGADLTIEFVSKDDPMPKVLLRNKDDQYAEYSLEHFEQFLGEYFKVERKEQLKSGTRYLFFAKSKQQRFAT